MNTSHHSKIEAFKKYLNYKIVGQEKAVELCITSLIAGGHILIEGPPGTGKTSLANAIANCINASFRRIQLTSDLLPSDIIGFSRLKNTGDFEFRAGPVFANIVLADEFNRTSPKTQSALLEAMAEGHVTVDGKSHPLPHPFFVMATQNPFDHLGAFPVTESQLDRFMFMINVDIPNVESERALLFSRETNEPAPALSTSDIIEWRTLKSAIHIDQGVLSYAHNIVSETRNKKSVAYGVSVRGLLQFIEAAKSRAIIHKRNFVIPEDFQILAPYVLAHRLSFREGNWESEQRRVFIHEILQSIPQPK